MADQFAVTPDELRRVSAHLSEVSSRMKAVMSTLRGQLAARGPQWGGDEMGSQFANGPDGYLAQLDYVNGSVDAKTALLDYYADMLKQAADTFAQSDQPGLSYAPPDSSVDQSAPFTQYGSTQYGSAGALPAGAIGGTPPADMYAGGPGAAGAVPGTQGGLDNAPAAPTTDTGAGAADAGGSAPGSSGGPGSSGDPSQSGSAGEGSGSSGAASGTEGVPDDGLSGAADSGNAEGMSVDAGSPEQASDPSVTSPDSGPVNGDATPSASDPAAPPTPPALPTPPASPNKRRRGAPDGSSSGPPGPESEGPPGNVEGSGATPADRRTQRSGARPDGDAQADDTGAGRRAQDSSKAPGRPASAAGRAGATGGDSVRPETAARARRGGSDRARRRDVTGDQADVDVPPGDRDAAVDDQVDDGASAASERQPSGGEAG